MNIIKRDGSVVEFDRNKITLAIKKALEACDMASDTIAISVTEDVVTAIGDVPEIDQERVQDLVEDALMKRGLLKVAKAYIKYRYRHAMARNSNIELYNGVLDKLAAKHVQNQNANVDENSFGGRMGEANILVLKDIALNFKMSDKTRNNHLQNIVYQHDMEHWATGAHNCLQLPLAKLLADGVTLRQGDIRSPNYISSALQQLVVLIQSQSTQMFGGCAAVIDFALVPYVRRSFKDHYIRRAFEDYMFDRDMTDVPVSEDMKNILWKYPTKASWYALDDDPIMDIEKAFIKWYMDVKGLTDEDFKFDSTTLEPTRKMCALHDTRREAHQAMEGLFHNLVSILARSGSQLPFSSCDSGLCTEPEGRLITEQMLICCMEGIGKLHTTAIFPITIFVCKKGVNLYPGDPNYDLFQLALKCTAKRLYPMFLNGDWSNQKVWVAADREAKKRVIDGLTEEQTTALIQRLAENEKLGDKLMLNVVDGKIEIDQTERDFEAMTCMGCMSGATVINYRMNGTIRTDSFENVWAKLQHIYEVKLQPNQTDYYMDTPGVEIYDGAGVGYVDMQRIICNHTKRWLKIWFSDGSFWRVTYDHPCCVFHEKIEREIIVRAENLKIGDKMLHVGTRLQVGIAKYVFVTDIMRDYEVGYSYDVTTSSSHFMANGILSHNCRTVNGFDLNAEDSYRQAIVDVIQTGDTNVDILSGAQKYGRGNIAPVTIILPELAMIANRDVEAFMQLLEIKIQDAAESLIERFEIIKSQPPSAAPFMYTNHTMAGYIPEEGIESALKHGTFAIGQLGLAEALQLLIGTDHTTKEGMELAKRIEQLYKDKINELRAKYKMNFGVYGSPAENLCYTALKKFREKYGVIPNVSDKDYFTNSMHIPVHRRVNAFEKIDLESQLTGYTTAGCTTWAELPGDVKNNIEALEKLVVYAMEHDIPYFGANLPNDQCQDCGYLGDIQDKCPKCGSSNIKSLKRITGYCSTDYRHFNPGKQDEVHHRVKHIG